MFGVTIIVIGLLCMMLCVDVVFLIFFQIGNRIASSCSDVRRCACWFLSAFNQMRYEWNDECVARVLVSCCVR